MRDPGIRYSAHRHLWDTHLPGTLSCFRRVVLWGGHWLTGSSPSAGVDCSRDWFSMTIETPGSVTHWLTLLQAGDPSAAGFLWDRYFAQVLQLAHHQLLGLRDRSRDAEDVALSTLNALCHAARQGRLANLHDRHDLWRLLVTCALNRVRNLRLYENRLKRGGSLAAETVSLHDPQVTGTVTPEPSPEEAAQLADDLRHLMDRLDVEDPTHRLREVALLKLEGYTVEEIARRQKCARKTIALRLSVIRGLWRRELLT